MLDVIPYQDDFKEELISMIMTLYREDPGEENMSLYKIEKTIQELAKRPEKGVIYLLKKKEIITGYAIVIWFWSNEFGGNIAVVDELFVKPNWRNQKIGTNFIDFLKQHKKPSSVALQVEVTPSNQRAYRLYRKIGFEDNSNNCLFFKL